MSQLLCMRWPKYWRFSFSIIPSKEHPGLISFRMDWLDLLAVQGTLRSLLQHHSSKASILWCSAFFTVQLSHPYIPAIHKYLSIYIYLFYHLAPLLSDYIFPISESLTFIYLFCHLKFFLIGGYLLYNIVLVSAIHQHESAIGICMS